jgi:hypothetical protein
MRDAAVMDDRAAERGHIAPDHCRMTRCGLWRVDRKRMGFQTGEGLPYPLRGTSRKTSLAGLSERSPR